MAVEIQILGYAVLLAAAQLFLFAIPANREVGSRYLAGPRDEGVRLTGVTARLQRAYQNHVETLPWFAAAVFVTYAAGAFGATTAAGAWLYIIARILYVPAYAFGVRYVRSLIWMAAILGIFLVLIPGLLAG